MNNFAEFALRLHDRLQLYSDQDKMSRAASDELRDALSSANFRIDCVERALLSMANGRHGWTNPPIFTDVTAGFVVRLLYWPAKYVGDIHTHNFWTVTGVLNNEITVVKYSKTNTSELQEVNRYYGKVGDVGYITPPCTHQAINETQTPSVTIAVFHRRHLISRDIPEVEWVERSNEERYSKGIYDRALRAHIFILDQHPGDRSLQLLDEAYDLAPIGLKLLATKAIAKHRPEVALKRLEEIIFLMGNEHPNVDEIRQVKDSLSMALTI
ncbi:hypothetical protein [Chromobacterium aquaticum]|uniref:Uncharacterized protein n=1 Tax=Chromobacterium aquaticum TaxID=467180 RepID=A0ABV8ZL97_9NEIS|nr:hypothetical protein [Chromobacterium aquaticum]MCD5361244.1 hypothetical protein [Chromobacterium aquaticum]